ncbi:MAG: Fic family protein [Vicinamibacterales bacterium]
MDRDRPHQPIETVQRIEPARLENPPESVADLVAELSSSSAKLGRSLHQRTAANLAELVRVMNTYYSNLIEGHTTRPRDIERALAGDFDRDEKRRSLQIEAAAHVRVQAEIDRIAAEGSLPEPASVEFIRWLHREFYRDAPKTMLRIRGAGRDFTMIPGEWRSRPMHEVAVGRHIPPSSQHVDEFMRYFAERYRVDRLGKASRVIVMAAAHHRLNFIHPFPDGNGRVSRLMSHAMAWSGDVAAHGLWSVSRGLARGLENRDEYTQMMDMADTPRQGDFDGRGNLSERALVDFVAWFLKVAIDQVTFMSDLFDLNTLARRLRSFIEHHDRLRPEAARLLEEALIRGEIERGEAPRITGLAERTARRVLNDLVSEGLLASTTSKGPVSLRFPVHALEVLFPRLYPATTVMDVSRSFDEQLRFAIKNHRLIKLRYHGNVRVAEPHDYGVHNGIERVLVYQLTGVHRVRQQSVAGWRLLDVSNIEECEVLKERFQGSRGQSHRNHHVWDIVYARVD